VALTAHALASDRARCMAAGCDDVLTKPVDRGELVSAVFRAVKRGVAATPVPAPEVRIVSAFAGDPEMEGLLDEYVAELRTRSALLRAAVASADWKGIEHIAHQLKGSAGGYGFASITAAAGELEHLAEGSRDARATDQRVGELTALCASACARARF
jgi:HPt (histidine-containing phosphotransfer) domain-containing protein